jgi:AbrB family looped-hinge helix DNA binding protein
MKVTSKGQVTIPQSIRDKAGIRPGSEVEFQIIKGEILVKKSKATDPGKAAVDRMIGKGDVKLTTDQIMKLTRGRR